MTIANDPLFSRLRVEAEEMFLTDTVKVERPGGRSLANGLERVAVALVYVGKARKVSGGGVTGGKEGSQACIVEFPWEAFIPQEGDVVTWVESVNPGLVGSKVVLKGTIDASVSLLKVRAEERV